MKLKETIIKALSLGTGVAIGLILIAKVCYEMSYDTCYADYDQIYRYALHIHSTARTGTSRRFQVLLLRDSRIMFQGWRLRPVGHL